MKTLIVRLFDWLHQFLVEDIVSTTYLFFANNIVYLLLFVCALLIVWYNRKDATKGYRLLFGFTLIALLFIYEPLINKVFMRLPATNDGVRARFWIICPIWLVISFGFAVLISRIKSVVFKCIIVALIAIMIIFAGDTIRNLNMVSEPANIYKVNNTAVELSDAVLELSQGEPTSLMVFVSSNEFGEDNYIDGGTTCMGINQYTGDIQVHRFAYLDEQWNDYFVAEIIPDGTMSGEQYVNYFFDIYFEPYEIEYAAMPNDERIIPNMEYSGYQLVGSVEGYFIFKQV